MKNLLKNLIVLGAVAMFAITTNANAQFNAIPSATEAILNGSINPNGTATSGWFEYGTDVNMNYANKTPSVYMGSSYGENPISQTISLLSPNTVYYYRAVASNGIVSKGATLSFATTATTVQNTVATTNYTYTNPAPVYTNTYSNTPVYTNTSVNNNIGSGVSISNVSSNGAILNAILTNPNRENAQGYFEYGMTKSFGSTTELNNLGNDYTSNFSGTLSGLNPNTTYYFRAVAILNGKTIKGGARSFQTFNSTVSAVNNYQAPQAPSVTTNQEQLIGNQTNLNSNPTLNSNSVLSANAVVGVNFLPDNIFGWLLLILVILLIVWIIRRLTRRTTYVVEK